MKLAEWIWLNAENNADEYAVFDLPIYAKKGGKVFLALSVGGDYALELGGKLVSFGQYADYVHYKVYDTLDLTDSVSEGLNVFRLICWYTGVSSSVYLDAGAGVIFEAYDENGAVLAYSDAGAKCALAKNYVSYRKKFITGQLGLSYTYDARGEREEPEWKSAVRVNNFGKELVSRPNKKLVLNAPTLGKKVREDKNIYDLGRECCGFLSIEFNAPAGETVKIAYGEHLKDGDVRSSIDGRDFSVELIGSGETVSFTGPFRRLGCRYLQVYGNAEIYSIGLRETVYPLNVLPYFVNDENRRRIYETSLKTLELCMHEHYEDCPWREQAMYIMDSRNQMRCGYYTFENKEFAAAAIRLIAEGQKENGLFDLCFPASVPITIPAFSLTFPSVVYEYAAFYGENSIVLEMFGKIEKTMSYFIGKLEENGLFRTGTEEGIWHFYEWAGDADLDGAFFFPDMSVRTRDYYDVLINAFISLACSITAKLCEIIKNFARREYYLKIKESVSKGIRQTFLVEEKGLFKTRTGSEAFSALANALCILCGACTENEEKSIAQKLAYGYDGWLENTLSMNIFRFDALLKVDKAKYSKVILEEIDKTYGYMLAHGATSFWETIKGEEDFGRAGSLCHGWSAIPVYYYRILGVTGKAEKTPDEMFALKQNN